MEQTIGSHIAGYEAVNAAIDIERFLPFSLTTVTNRLARCDSRRYLREFGVGIIEWRVLVALSRAPGATANQVSTMIAVDKAAVSRSLGRLLKLAHVTNDRHGRKSVLRLTPSGMALHERMAAAAMAREQVLLAGFGAAEQTQLLGMLKRLTVNVARLEK